MSASFKEKELELIREIARVESWLDDKLRDVKEAQTAVGEAQDELNAQQDRLKRYLANANEYETRLSEMRQRLITSLGVEIVQPVLPLAGQCRVGSGSLAELEERKESNGQG